jgi:hypothetical protein
LPSFELLRNKWSSFTMRFTLKNDYATCKETNDKRMRFSRRNCTDTFIDHINITLN